MAETLALKTKLVLKYAEDLMALADVWCCPTALFPAAEWDPAAEMLLCGGFHVGQGIF